VRQTVEALLFDVGGVIVDIDFARVTARWAQHAGCDAAALQERYKLDDAFHRYESGGIGVADYFAALRETLDVDLSDEQFLDGWNAIFGGVIAGAEDWIGPACARLPAYLFSNTNPAHAAYVTARYASAFKPFRKLFASSEIGLVKPDRAAFEHVTREIGVAAPQILFFDDTLVNVEGARAAGLQAVHVRSNADVTNALASLAPNLYGERP